MIISTFCIVNAEYDSYADFASFFSAFALYINFLFTLCKLSSFTSANSSLHLLSKISIDLYKKIFQYILFLINLFRKYIIA